MSKEQLEGNKTIYNIAKNRYEIDSHKKNLLFKKN